MEFVGVYLFDQSLTNESRIMFEKGVRKGGCRLCWEVTCRGISDQTEPSPEF